MFFAPIRGGVRLDEQQSHEVRLHHVTLNYSIPGGAWGAPELEKRVINYRQKLHKFQRNGNTGRDYLPIDGAVWEYYRNSFVLNWLQLRQEIVAYRLGITKLPRVYAGNTPLKQLENYLWTFLEDFLEGPDGKNTRTRKFAPGESDEQLGSWLATMPERLERRFLAGWSG